MHAKLKKSARDKPRRPIKLRVSLVMHIKYRDKAISRMAPVRLCHPSHTSLQTDTHKVSMDNLPAEWSIRKAMVRWAITPIIPTRLTPSKARYISNASTRLALESVPENGHVIMLGAVLNETASVISVLPR